MEFLIFSPRRSAWNRSNARNNWRCISSSIRARKNMSAKNVEKVSSFTMSSLAHLFNVNVLHLFLWQSCSPSHLLFMTQDSIARTTSVSTLVRTLRAVSNPKYRHKRKHQTLAQPLESRPMRDNRRMQPTPDLPPTKTSGKREKMPCGLFAPVMPLPNHMNHFSRMLFIFGILWFLISFTFVVHAAPCSFTGNFSTLFWVHVWISKAKNGDCDELVEWQEPEVFLIKCFFKCSRRLRKRKQKRTIVSNCMQMRFSQVGKCNHSSFEWIYVKVSRFPCQMKRTKKKIG